MALKDSSGKITIDEYAAQQDIQKIHQAKAALENSKKAIDHIINQACNEQGKTAVAIVEKATELRNQINTMIGRLNETSSFISNTIAHYQEVDRLVKEAIQNSMNTSAVAATTSSPKSTSTTSASKPTTPKPSSSSSTKKTDNDGFIDDVVDAFSDAFKKFF
ncbi:MAG: hypothetical protein J6Q89_02455 [Clostridia bacterium]|nr:hypothetical protein [Clostridia bacterium]